MTTLPDQGDQAPQSEASRSSFELERFPEGQEIQERLDAEYARRIGIFRLAVEELEIPEDQIILAPRVHSRTDFGYLGDVDFVLLGTSNQRDRLYERLYQELGIFPNIFHVSQGMLEKIRKEVPEYYQHLMERRGNFPEVGSEAADLSEEGYWEEAALLEGRIRNLLQPEDRDALKNQRLEIADAFVNEIGERVQVLGHIVTGSTVEDSGRFGVCSDLDVDILYDVETELDEWLATVWISQYLVRKYAEEHDVLIDVNYTDLGFARRMAEINQDFRRHYQEMFGVDVLAGR